MQIIVQGRNVQVTDRLREYVEGKVDKLDRFLPTITEARMELSTEQTRSAEDRQVAQLTIRSKGVLLRSEERSADMFTSVDMVMDKIKRQIDRYKSKRRNRYRGAPAEPEQVVPEEEVEAAHIVRTKRFAVTPMDPEEAIEQMELLGHTFFVFYNVEDGQINVVYTRRDGNYGLLQPEVG
ncbi:MAG: ribosome-associated translation inhibitor RaiA [Anaerolineae bacterium]|nr:ribosome-associated translation inhibitor RaiA [Anaerolineae bacterium]